MTSREEFPIGLYSLLGQVYITRKINLRDYLSENIIELGPFSINRLIVVLAVIIVALPLRSHPWILGWLLLEFLVSGDVWNFLRYGHWMGIVMFLQRAIAFFLA